MFIRNMWYPIARSAEVSDQILARRICNEPLVVFRVNGKQPAVLEDRCCHRGAPLSLGKVLGDRLQCGYHGLEFNADGTCAHIPCQEMVSANAKVKSYPTVERHRFIWAWFGDPSLSDPDSIPDLHWNDDPQWAGDGSTLYIKCNHQFLIDNLLDLTHETYVHAQSAGHPMITSTPATVSSTQDTVTVGRVYGPLLPPSPWSKWIKEGMDWEGEVMRYHYSTFMLPCIVNIETGAVRGDLTVPNYTPKESIRGYLINCCVPETETTCWQFWSWPRNYSIDDDALTQSVVEDVNKVFYEDVEMLEGQQRRAVEMPDRGYLTIASDAGPMMARRIVKGILDRQHVES